MTSKTFLSLGAGVQSTTLALMCAHKEIEPMPDAAIFADTHEPAHVYSHLTWLSKQLPFPIITVRKGDIFNDVLYAAKHGKRVGNPPFYCLNEDGSKAILTRVCTVEYKVNPLIREMRAQLGFAKGQRIKNAQATQYIGISLDEVTRMKESPHPNWLTNRWPLVEKRINRNGCFRWMEKHGYPKPPRSACTFCPYHADDYWRYLKNEFPEEFEEACLFDEAIRGGVNKTTAKALFLHRELIPLRDVDLRSDIDKGQLTLGFSALDECDSVCMI